MKKDGALRKYLAKNQIDASKMVHDEEEDFDNTIPTERYADDDSECKSIQKKKKRPKHASDWD